MARSFSWNSMFVYMQVLLIVCAFGSLAKFYWLQPPIFSQSNECYIVTVVSFFMIATVMTALWRGHNEERNYLKEGEVKDSEESALVCKQCGALRPDDRTHHCSKCKRCVTNMDHHCIFMDNCVGTYTLRYFIQYTVWALISLIWGVFNFIRCMYNQNVYNN